MAHPGESLRGTSLVRSPAQGEGLAQRIGVPLVAAGMMAIAAAAPAPAWSATLMDWNYSPQTGALAFELDTAEKPKYFFVANPMRIVLELPGSYAYPQALEAQAGGVFTNIRAANTKSGKVRLVLQFAPGTVLEPGQVELIALGDGRWSLQPLLANGEQFVPKVPTSAAVSPPPGTIRNPKAVQQSSLPKAASEESEVRLPSLEAMEVGALETVALKPEEAEFVSMEETLARQKAEARATASERLEVPQATVPLGKSAGAAGTVQWGENQLPPVPELATLPSGEVDLLSLSDPAGLPQLPQPRLGQAPLALNTLTEQSLVDPAKVVDRRQLPGWTRSAVNRPPAAVEPVIDPKLLSLDAEQQGAASLRGPSSARLPVERSAASPQRPVVPAAAPQSVEPATAVATDETPFLVEFGAPIPDLER